MGRTDLRVVVRLKGDTLIRSMGAGGRRPHADLRDPVQGGQHTVGDGVRDRRGGGDAGHGLRLPAAAGPPHAETLMEAPAARRPEGCVKNHIGGCDFLRKAPLPTRCYAGNLAPTEGSRRQMQAGSVPRGLPRDRRGEILRSRASGSVASSFGGTLPQRVLLNLTSCTKRPVILEGALTRKLRHHNHLRATEGSSLGSREARPVARVQPPGSAGKILRSAPKYCVRAGCGAAPPSG